MTRLNKPVEETDHTLGPDNAPVTLVEYGSYDCPHCKQAVPILSELRTRYDAPLRFVYRHFPRETRNSPSHRAAEAAEAAGKQGHFWDMHAHLLENQQALDDASLLHYATYLGLDTARFAEDMKTQAHAERVREHSQNGVTSGVHSTPTFFINGVRHDDYWDVETLLNAVKAARDANNKK